MSSVVHWHGIAAKPAARLAPVSLALLLAACASQGLSTGALTTGEAERPTSATTATLADVAANQPPAPTHAANMAPPLATPLAEARRLRQSGDKAGALTLLDTAAAKAPDDAKIATERGLLALELGQIETALPLIKAAIKAAPREWRLHSAHGSALAAAGRHSQAQMAFAKALEIAPDHPSILNNLALSYALDGRHLQAEQLLRRAADARTNPPQARQNLALLLGLQGKSEEARQLSQAAMPPAEATANAQYLKALTASPQAPANTADRKQAADQADSDRARVSSAASDAPDTLYRLGGPLPR